MTSLSLNAPHPALEFAPLPILLPQPTCTPSDAAAVIVSPTNRGVPPHYSQLAFTVPFLALDPSHYAHLHRCKTPADPSTIPCKYHSPALGSTSPVKAPLFPTLKSQPHLHSARHRCDHLGWNLWKQADALAQADP